MKLTTNIKAGPRNPSVPMREITLSNGTVITVGGPLWVPTVE